MKLARGLAPVLVVLLLASAAPPDSTQAPPKKSVPAGWGPPAAPASPHGTKSVPASPHGTKPGVANPHGAKAGAAAMPAPPLKPGVAPPPPAADAKEPADGQPLKPTKFTLGVRHRVIHDFAEKAEVKLKEEFRIGDGEYSARIIEFVPDFMIENRKVMSRSRAPRNPAIRVVVKENGAVQDTSWAFLNFAPHFSAKSVLAFQVLKIEFENHPPVEARRDTTAAAKAHP